MNFFAKISFFSILILLAIVPVVTHAQATGIDPINIEYFPESPTPGQSVKITLKSFTTDLDRATIVWIQDKKVIEQGVGKPTFTFTTPAVGSSIEIIAVITTVEGATIRKSVSIRPGDVDIIIETDGYRPPLYRGKSPDVYQNTYRFIAIPQLVDKNGKQIDPKTVVYRWEKDYKVYGELSGYGKQVFTVKNGVIPSSFTVGVEVSSKNDGVRAQKTITINPNEPTIVMYREDPLYGVMYNKALTETVRLAQDEIKLLTAPYSFSDMDGVEYNWLINGNDQTDLLKNRGVTFRRSNDEAGTSNIDLSIKNTINIIQSAHTNFNMYFNKKDI